jgi:hypothetical protein
LGKERKTFSIQQDFVFELQWLRKRLSTRGSTYSYLFKVNHLLSISQGSLEVMRVKTQSAQHYHHYPPWVNKKRGLQVAALLGVCCVCEESILSSHPFQEENRHFLRVGDDS